MLRLVFDTAALQIFPGRSSQAFVSIRVHSWLNCIGRFHSSIGIVPVRYSLAKSVSFKISSLSVKDFVFSHEYPSVTQTTNQSKEPKQ